MEVKDKRTKYTKTFDIGDGEFETKTFSKPKHYKENGKWLEIDLNIKTGDGYFVEDNAIKTYFKEDPREKEVVQLDTDRGSLTYSPVSMRFSNGTDTELISEVQPSEVSIKENTINYLNEFPGVDDEFIVRADDIKDNLILKELPETTLTGEVYLEFVDVIKFDGSLVADGKKVEGNTKGIREIEVRNTRGQHVYTIPKLLTFEQDNRSNQIVGEYELKKDGEWYLISRVPLNWLKEAKLPVVIDPNTTIKADYNAAGVARVDSGKPDTNFYEISNYAQKASGYYHTVFLMQDGTVRAVGQNAYGQLGDGTTVDKSTPVDIGLTGVQGVAAGDYHTIFLMQDGTVKTVGRNNYGQLGDGTTVDKSTPVDILSGVQSAAAGNSHTVFLMDDGTVRTVGYNNFGQLGDGTTVDKSTPITINIGGTQPLQTLNVSQTEKSLVRFENVPQVGDKAFLALDVVDYNGVFDLVFKKVSGWNGDTVTYNTLPAGSEVKRVDGSKFIVDGVNNHPIWYIDVTDILEDPLDLLIETDNAQAGEFIKFDARSDV